MSQLRIFLALAAAAVVAPACKDGPTTPPEKQTPGIHFITAQTLTDSVHAQATITVELRDSAGKAAAGQSVVVAPILTATSPFVTVAGRLGGEPYAAITDAGGRVTVPVQLGHRVGEARVAVRAPVLGFVDTARYTITPGAAVRVVVAPKDSTVYVGGGYTVRATAVDRYDNPRTDTLQCAAADAVSATGCSVRGDRIGRGYLVARLGTTIADSAWVSVVPQAVIAAYDNHYPVDPQQKVVMANLDGSGIVGLGPGGGGPTTDVGLAWSPDGQELALISGISKLQVLHPGTVPHDLIQPSTQLAETAPRYSRDGSRIFYTAQDGYWQAISMYRAARDGTGATRFGPALSYAGYDYNPSPSPDGRYVVYVSGRDPLCTICNTRFVRIWDVQQDAPTSFSVSGDIAAWAPVGDLIAYGAGGGLYLTRPDGTGGRLLLANAYPRSIDWSPDGKWVLITTLNAAPRLIEVDTGQVLPIAWAAQYSELTWRP